MKALSLAPCALRKVMGSTTGATFFRHADTFERYQGLKELSIYGRLSGAHSCRNLATIFPEIQPLCFKSGSQIWYQPLSSFKSQNCWFLLATIMIRDRVVGASRILAFLTMTVTVLMRWAGMLSELAPLSGVSKTWALGTHPDILSLGIQTRIQVP